MLIQRFALFTLITLLTACQSRSTANTPLPATAIQLPSPTALPSPTPSLIAPTAVPTLAPAPRSFTEQFDAEIPYWTFQQIDLGSPAATPTSDNGFLVFDLTSQNQWIYAFYNLPDYTDIRLDARVEVRAGEAGAVGLVCRYTEAGGWYEFNIFADQTYELLYGQWLAPGLARYTPLFRGVSEKIRSDANEIGLVCKGDALTPFINGVQMRIWQDTRIGLMDGQVGISAASFATLPYSIAYDWVKVSQP